MPRGDQLFYRAEGPQSLIDAENRLWSPILAAAEKALGVRFMLAEGIVHVEQDRKALEAVARALEPYDALSLAALHSMTTLTGSALIALAVARGDLSAEKAWEAAHADEDWQMSQWGRDQTALEARASRWREMQAAALGARRGCRQSATGPADLCRVVLISVNRAGGGQFRRHEGSP